MKRVALNVDRAENQGVDDEGAVWVSKRAESVASFAGFLTGLVVGGLAGLLMGLWLG
jgi:hypothetical protein